MENDGMRNDECPNCGSGEYDDDGVSYARVGDIVYITVVCHCEECGENWTLAESFKLTGYTIGIKDDAGHLKLTYINASVGDEVEL